MSEECLSIEALPFRTRKIAEALAAGGGEPGGKFLC